jgi:hypothetical protein
MKPIQDFGEKNKTLIVLKSSPNPMTAIMDKSYSMLTAWYYICNPQVVANNTQITDIPLRLRLLTIVSIINLLHTIPIFGIFFTDF